MQLIRFNTSIRGISSGYYVRSFGLRHFSIASVSTGGEDSPSAFQHFLQNKSAIIKLNKGVNYFIHGTEFQSQLKNNEVNNLPLNTPRAFYKNRLVSRNAELSQKVDFKQIKSWIDEPKESNLVESFNEFLNTFPEDERQALIEATIHILSRRSIAQIKQNKLSSNVVQTNVFDMLLTLYLEFNLHQKHSDDNSLNNRERTSIEKENYHLKSILYSFYAFNKVSEIVDFYEKLEEKYEINLDIEICERLFSGYLEKGLYKKAIYYYNQGKLISDNIEITDFPDRENYQIYLQQELVFFATVANSLIKVNQLVGKSIPFECIKRMIAKGHKPNGSLSGVILNLCEQAGYVHLASDILNLLPIENRKPSNYQSIITTVSRHWRLFNFIRFLENFYERKDASKILDIVENTSFAALGNFPVLNDEEDKNIIVDEEYKERIKKRVSTLLIDPLKRASFYETCSHFKIDIDPTEKATKIDEIDKYMKSFLDNSAPLIRDSDNLEFILKQIAKVYLKMNNFEYFEEFVKEYSLLDIDSSLANTLISLYYYANKGDTTQVENLANSDVFNTNISLFDRSAFSQVFSTLASMKNEVGFDAIVKIVDKLSRGSTYKIHMFLLVDIERSYLESGISHPIGDIILNWKSSQKNDPMK